MVFGNKDRLYIALYARAGEAKMPGGEDSYHWALIVGPKDEDPKLMEGWRFHAKDPYVGGGGSKVDRQWIFEERKSSLLATNMLLVRIVVGKVKDTDRLRSVLKEVPVVRGDPSWNCVEWVRTALEALEADKGAMGTSQFDWGVIRETAMKYCREKRDAGRFQSGTAYDTSRPPTFDLLEGKELLE